MEASSSIDQGSSILLPRKQVMGHVWTTISAGKDVSMKYHPLNPAEMLVHTWHGKVQKY